jgi:SAM-dependent methyltransferase
MVPEPNQIDWLRLWRELVEAAIAFGDPGMIGRHGRRGQAGKAAKERSDPLVEFVASGLSRNCSLIDIGAATGRWTIPLARVAAKVTAVEPDPGSLAVLNERASQSGLNNIRIVAENWEACDLPAHDVVINSHAMYGTPDLAGLVASMQRRAKEACYLAMRVVNQSGVMGELSRQIHGHPHDSANFQVGFNALLQMDIYPNVLIEPVVKHWVDDSLEGAHARAKRHLRLAPDDTSHDDLIRDCLSRRLNREDGRFVWPDWMRSGLMWWRTAA